jgi:integrase
MRAECEQTSREKSWCWPINVVQYERAVRITSDEQRALQVIVESRYAQQKLHHPDVWSQLERLVQPVDDVLNYITIKADHRNRILLFVLREMFRRGKSFWGWSETDWNELFARQRSADECRFSTTYRRIYRESLMIVSYLLGCVHTTMIFGKYNQALMASRVFGQDLVDAAMDAIQNELTRWGYRSYGMGTKLKNVVCDLLLNNRSPYVEDMTIEVIRERYQQGGSNFFTDALIRISRALEQLKITNVSLAHLIGERKAQLYAYTKDTVAEEWIGWIDRWRQTTTIGVRTRAEIYYHLIKVGRWLAHSHPDITSPSHWDQELAIEYVALVDRMCVGDWSHHTNIPAHKSGKPLRPAAKAGRLTSIRRFFRDCQEWGWIARSFDPVRCFRIPQAVHAQLTPNPRVIADDIWAKLLWAGLNVKEEDLAICGHPSGSASAARTPWGPWYPIEMVRAVTLVWLFAGLRCDEIRRLRVGCVRWQSDAPPKLETSEASHSNRICFLDIPVNKTSPAFSKPVDGAVGEAITVWEAVRPSQPELLDSKSGELVHYLFSYRGKQLGRRYINRQLVPIPCRKAGVPEADARGKITSHRARHTIATQLFNAKEPLSLFELQEWMGHRSPATTQYYAKITPTKLAKSFAAAGYFERNLRTIEVLIDQEAILSGAAMNGAPWKFYDLGHGYCTYDFFEQCPHRMACAKCAFYRPKGSSQAQLLEAKANLGRMLQEIPLSEDERAAVEDGLRAIEQLSVQLLDVPTPAGPTPRQLATQTIAERAVRIGRPGSGALGSGERSGEGGEGGAGEGVGA